MKPQKFRDSLYPLFLVMEILIIILMAFWTGFGVYSFYLCYSQNDIEGMWMSGIIFISLFLFTFFLFFNSPRIIYRAFGRLIVYENRIVLKCPFRMKKAMMFSECHYIGVENYDGLNPGMPKERGDETSFIYFSKIPFPQKYRGKITMLQDSKNILKFSYRDDLCELLMRILPEEKCTSISIFYEQMKAIDRKIKKLPNKKKK